MLSSGIWVACAMLCMVRATRQQVIVQTCTIDLTTSLGPVAQCTKLPILQS